MQQHNRTFYVNEGKRLRRLNQRRTAQLCADLMGRFFVSIQKVKRWNIWTRTSRAIRPTQPNGKSPHVVRVTKHIPISDKELVVRSASKLVMVRAKRRGLVTSLQG